MSFFSLIIDSTFMQLRSLHTIMLPRWGDITQDVVQANTP